MDMNKRRAVFVLVAASLIVALAAGAAGCAYIVDGTDVSGYMPVTLTTYAYFGCETSVNVYVADDGEKERLYALWSDGILPLIAATETSLSCYSDPDQGAIARFNASAPGEKTLIDKCAYDAIALCLRAWEDTDGAFNPATALSLDLWGFTDRFLNGSYVPTQPYDRADPHTQLPDARYVDAFARLADKFGDIELSEEDGSYFATKPSDAYVTVDGADYSLCLELGGIGKGIAADSIAQLLRDNGFVFGYVSVGGSSLVMLANAARMSDEDRGLFDVSVVDPYGGGYYYSYLCRDVAVSTSGNYRNSYELGGRTYSHIIGKDGVPYDTDVVTASLFGPSAALCDAYTTAMCVMGTQGGAVGFAEKPEGYGYVLVSDDGEPTVISNLGGEILQPYREVTP